ncbi:hypothetical protein NU08_4200 [Flavobacterium anhuiense]|uniref:Uncharacterized protein n=1 Tax=Flavobacterium anhuiense TaxID=459526 RepID=A0A444VT54_9FLAO|nr:hypothetical protein NU08_4200 [Flavobacterium anhuiense]
MLINVFVLFCDLLFKSLIHKIVKISVVFKIYFSLLCKYNVK